MSEVRRQGVRVTEPHAGDGRGTSVAQSARAMGRASIGLTLAWCLMCVLRLPAAPPRQAAAGYAGSDACALCHTTEATTLTGTKHGQTNDPRSPAATRGCESCHGPGQAHIDDDAKGQIKKFGALDPAAINETCLTCHNRRTHAGWSGSAHEARNLSCTTCHAVHKPASFAHQLSRAPSRNCARNVIACRWRRRSAPSRTCRSARARRPARRATTRMARSAT